MSGLILLDSVDSTNTYLKKLAYEDAPGGTAVAAAIQTAGRGRSSGNSFISEPGGLYYSYLLRTSPLSPAEASTLTAKTAVAVVRALDEFIPDSAGIKWVNDIMLNGRKLCGILTEAGHAENGLIPFAVIGIGINVNQSSFPDEISGKATSIFLETGKKTDIRLVADAVTAHLDYLAKHLADDSAAYFEEYQARCISIGKNVLAIRNNTEELCFATGISSNYGLAVTFSDGRKEILTSGEARIRGACGYI